MTKFLGEAADELEQALKEIDRLRQEPSRAEAAIAEYRERENSLRNTLLTAQRLADSDQGERRERSPDDAPRSREPRRPAAAEGAGPPHRDRRDINEMRLRRRDVEGSLEASIASLTYALEFMRGQDQAERDEKLLLHRPKTEALAAAAVVRVGRRRPAQMVGVTRPPGHHRPRPCRRPSSSPAVAQNSDARPQVAEAPG